MDRPPASICRVALLVAAMAIGYLATTPLAVPAVEDLNDKLSHILAFFTLALLLDFSFPSSRFGFSKIAALLGYGLLIEVVQYFLPYRTFSLLDWAADGMGVALYGFSLPLLRRGPRGSGR
jgi:VanZ family protein